MTVSFLFLYNKLELTFTFVLRYNMGTTTMNDMGTGHSLVQSSSKLDTSSVVIVYVKQETNQDPAGPVGTGPRTEPNWS